MAKLVAIGDSLTQGFHSLAITNTEQSFPAIIARALGLGIDQFRQPDFRGKGGLPCSIEWLARRLEETYGADLSTFEWIRAVHTITDCIDEVEDYWERGKGAQPTAKVDYHNLAVWGFEAGDALDIDAAMCAAKSADTKDNWFRPPSAPRYRTALNVLNPSRDAVRGADTQVSIAERIARRDGGIDHLVLWLGANNCLRTVVELEVRETDDDPPGPGSDRTLWKPAAFEKDFVRVAARVAAIGAQHTYVATVPHVTIPPITRGVMANRGRLPDGHRYFDYYTRFSIHDKEFDPDRDPKLLKAQAQTIDGYIDQYNGIIRRETKKYGWHLVDICDVLDRLAVRRNHGKPSYALPAPISDLSIRFLEIQASGSIKAGGLIGLDGVHPTACGYGIVAQEFINVMRAHEPTIADVDFDALRRSDTLVSYPPRTLNDMLGALRTLEKWFHISRWMKP